MNSAKSIWPNLLKRAHQLGISPAVFWQLSFCEWRAIANDDEDLGTMTREDFQQLAQKYAD